MCIIYTYIQRETGETQLSRLNLLCELHFYKVQKSSNCDHPVSLFSQATCAFLKASFICFSSNHKMYSHPNLLPP